MFKYYINSHKVKDFGSLVNLIIADRQKDCLPDNVHNYVEIKEANEVFLPTKIAVISDLYINELVNKRQAIYSHPRLMRKYT